MVKIRVVVHIFESFTEFKKKYLVVADMMSEFDKKQLAFSVKRERENEGGVIFGRWKILFLTISETEPTYHCIMMHLFKERVKLAAFQKIISRNINEGDE